MAKEHTDSGIETLFDEISQEVKAKEFENFLKRYGKVIGTVLLLIVVGTAGYNAWTHVKIQQQEKDSEKLIALIDKQPVSPSKDELKEILKSYLELGEKGAGEGHRMLARLAEVGTLLKSGERDTAIARLKDMQADTSIKSLYRDYALLMQIHVRMDKEEDAQKLQDELKPLLDPKNAWYLSALETSAVLYAKIGKKDEAVNQLQGILSTEDAPLSARERAGQLARLYGVK
jgi:hypothetical protein